jgi:hypothetical protein
MMKFAFKPYYNARHIWSNWTPSKSPMKFSSMSKVGSNT